MPVVIHKHMIPLNEGEITLYRYMNLQKLESILQNRALYYCRLDIIQQKEDMLEGSLPKREEEFQKQTFAGNNLLKYQNIFKKYLYVNCWHISESESRDMWKNYLKNEKGVAILSTQTRITNCFNDTKESICFSKIKYIDYINDIFYDKVNYPNDKYSFFKPIIFKDSKYLFEKEYRIIYDIINTYGTKNRLLSLEGVNISINVNTLIEKIILMPNTDDDFKNEIKELQLKYKFDFPIEKSKLEL